MAYRAVRPPPGMLASSSNDVDANADGAAPPEDGNYDHHALKYDDGSYEKYARLYDDGSYRHGDHDKGASEGDGEGGGEGEGHH